MIGYKLLRTEGTSLSEVYGSVTYPLDGTPIDVPGRGAFVGLSVPGLLRGGYGPLLAACEYEDGDRLGGDSDVAEVRRVCVVRTATIYPCTLVRVAIRAARDVAHLSSDPRVAAAIEAAERCEHECKPAAAWAAAAAAAEAAEATAWAAEAAARARILDYLVAEAWGGAP